MLTSSQLGQTLNIHTLAPGVLPSVYKSVIFEDILSYKTAMKLGVDIYAMHSNIYPFISENGVPNDPTKYQYAMFNHMGKELILGMPWIDQESVEVMVTTSIEISIPNVGSNDIEAVKRALISNGFTPGRIEVVATGESGV